MNDKIKYPESFIKLGEILEALRATPSLPAEDEGKKSRFARRVVNAVSSLYEMTGKHAAEAIEWQQSNGDEPFGFLRREDIKVLNTVLRTLATLDFSGKSIPGQDSSECAEHIKEVRESIKVFMKDQRALPTPQEAKDPKSYNRVNPSGSDPLGGGGVGDRRF